MKHNDTRANRSWNLLFLTWIIATVATLGSLFFSEVMGYVPCTLCWYQRIMMYPLVIILLAGMLPYDRTIFRYATPLVVLGWGFAFYHNLVQMKIIPKSASPCIAGIPCTTKYIEYFGFITIPLLSFIAFSLIGILLYMIKKKRGLN